MTVISLLLVSAVLAVFFGAELENYKTAASGNGAVTEHGILLWAILGTSLVIMFVTVSIAAIRRENMAARYDSLCKDSDDLNRRLERVTLFSGNAASEETSGPASVKKTETGKAMCEYCLKYYLNASHFVTIGGERGTVHPHTWEFTLVIGANREETIRFSDFDKAVDSVLAKYRNRVVNEIAPFDTVMPTVENLTDCLAQEFKAALAKIGAQLISVEAEETPTRSYRIYME